MKKRASNEVTIHHIGDGSTTRFPVYLRFSSAKDDSRITVDGRRVKAAYRLQADTTTECIVDWCGHSLEFVAPPAAGVKIEFTGHPLVNVE